MEEETMSSEKKADNGMHIAVIPWFAHGHILPVLDLSMLLSDKGHRVTLISTPSNISIMKTSSPDHHPLHFAEVPMPAVEGLPSGKDNTRDIEESQITNLIQAMQMLYEPLKHVLSQISPHCVISDLFVPPSAYDLGIPNMSLGLSTVAIITAGWQNDSTDPLFKRPTKDSDKNKDNNTQNSVSAKRHCFEVWRSKCYGILSDSCKEMEEEYVHVLQEKLHKPVYAIGPLLSRTHSASSVWDDKCREWLQSQSSAIYVAFGSECSISEAQSEEIGLGLEASGVPFIWAVGRCKLPHGFESRVDRKQGIILRGWVPQREILGSDKVRGFMSHCGWNSIKEAIISGVSVVAVPMQYDQMFTGRFVSLHLKTGVLVERESNGLYGRESICKCVKTVMVEDGDVSARACELANVLLCDVLQPGGSRDRQLDLFLRFISASQTPNTRK